MTNKSIINGLVSQCTRKLSQILRTKNLSDYNLYCYEKSSGKKVLSDTSTLQLLNTSS